MQRCEYKNKTKSFINKRSLFDDAIHWLHSDQVYGWRGEEAALLGGLAGYAIGGRGNPGAVLVGAGVGALAGGIAGHELNKERAKATTTGPNSSCLCATAATNSSLNQQVEDERSRLEIQRLQMERKKVQMQSDALK